MFDDHFLPVSKLLTSRDLCIVALKVEMRLKNCVPVNAIITEFISEIGRGDFLAFVSAITAGEFVSPLPHEHGCR